MSITTIIALGANLPSVHGDPKETLEAAKKALGAHGLPILKKSRTYLTAPVPVSDDPWYHNEVVMVETQLQPRELLNVLNTIECTFGRVRTVQNAPRVLDLDIIAYGEAVVQEPDLVIPHVRMQQRLFVLRPLKDVAPEWRHPVTGISVSELIAAVSDDQEIQLCDV